MRKSCKCLIENEKGQPEAKSQFSGVRKRAVVLAGDQPEHNKNFCVFSRECMPVWIVQKLTIELDPGWAPVFEVLKFLPVLYRDQGASPSLQSPEHHHISADHSSCATPT